MAGVLKCPTPHIQTVGGKLRAKTLVT